MGVICLIENKWAADKAPWKAFDWGTLLLTRKSNCSSISRMPRWAVTELLSREWPVRIKLNREWLRSQCCLLCKALVVLLHCRTSEQPREGTSPHPRSLLWQKQETWRNSFQVQVSREDARQKKPQATQCLWSQREKRRSGVQPVPSSGCQSDKLQNTDSHPLSLVVAQKPEGKNEGK